MQIGMIPEIDYGTANIAEFRLQKRVSEKTGKATVTSIELPDGRQVVPTERFWVSTQARFGLSNSIYNLFDHEEVFERIAQRKGGEVRYAIQRSADEDRSDALLAVTSTTKSIVPRDTILELLDGSNPDSISYNNGTISSLHRPRIGRDIEIGGDAFKNRFTLDTPIDGYGNPSIYLALLRMACTNLSVAMSPTFRSSVPVGKNEDQSFAISRVLDQFNSDEGFSALVSRFENAQRSWASVGEALSLYKLLMRAHNDRHDFFRSHAELSSSTTLAGLLDAVESYQMSYGVETIGHRLISAFHEMTGDISSHYGLANLDALSQKKQAILPAGNECTVYDLINFATEVATHYATPLGASKFNGWVGNLLSAEYDMEGTVDKIEDFQDFFMGSKLSSGMTGSD